MKAESVAAAIIALASAPPVAAAQGGQSASILLELPASPRAMALGGAGTALDGDAAVFYNPAQIAAVARLAAGLSVQRYILSSTLGAVSAAARIGPGTLAFGAQVLQYASEPEIVPDESSGGEQGRATGATIDASDLAATVAFAVERGTVRVGVAGKIVRQQIVEESGVTAAADVGVAVRGWRGVTMGAAVQNLGGSIQTGATAARLPRALRFGAAAPFAPGEPFSLVATADVVMARATEAVAGGGMEFVWRATPSLSVAARVGGMALPADHDGSPLTAGGAVIGRSIALDYAFRSFDAAGGGIHRIGIRWWR